MNIRELVERNRSYRRFDSSVKIEADRILEWIDLARLSASGRNAQPLKYEVVIDSEMCDAIFPHIGWAGYLKDWNGPAEGERPVAYVAVLKDLSVSEKHYCDDGLAMQNLLLGAVAEGFGGCILGAVNREKVATLLQLPDHLEILWLVALGKPAETVVLEEAKDDIKYWRDDEQVHHVPKRPLTEVVVQVI